MLSPRSTGSFGKVCFPTVGRRLKTRFTIASTNFTVILSHDVYHDRPGIVIAVAITSQEPRAGFPLTLEITTAKLPKQSWARLGQIRTLSVERLGKRLGRVAPEELDRVVEGLKEIIGG